VTNRDNTERWLAGKAIPGVKSGLNDAVRVVAGPSCGSVGAVISFAAVVPDPMYLVELGAGGDVQLAQSQLAQLGDKTEGAV
jgi:hypothetical protein